MHPPRATRIKHCRGRATQVRDHARQLLEKHVRKPFFAAQYAGDFQRMDPEAVDAGLAWLDQRFHVIRYEVRHAAGLHRAMALHARQRLFLHAVVSTG